MPPNPLRRPKPSRDESLYRSRFYFGSEGARIEGAFGFSIVLGRDYLWLGDELSVPLWAIRHAEIFEAGWYPKRRALKITYENPITSLPEAIILMKPDFFGLNAVKPLKELLQKLDAARASASRPVSISSANSAVPLVGLEPVDACEICGEKPAYYVGYTYLISALVVSYRGAVKRRIHCRKHNLVHGLGHYLVTAATGWFGIGIFAYPYVVFGASRSLEPSIGRRATYVLAAAPILVVAVLILRWLQVV